MDVYTERTSRQVLLCLARSLFAAMEDPRTDPRDYDDDGRLKRSGTVWTASAHIITAVIGSGLLALPWASAQLGWVVYPVMVLLFACIICYTSALLSDCYRSGDPSHGERNCTYIDSVKASLGRADVGICQFLYTPTSSGWPSCIP
ncbi:amino acid permease 4-like [Triticum dicoccoides]|uniref:amino acid permease 4-like n=1 Tax=Triticum dicoccoides TaxID=85692 RepID=UPI00188F651D|nr:amino acid permease 4-like [Triticum dicoccoides]